MDRSTLDAPIALNRKRRARRWNEHWPLPVAFVLAVGFWFYLDSRISSTRLYSCKIETDRQSSEIRLGENDGILRLRVPDGYTISSVRNVQQQQSGTGGSLSNVRLHFRGPKSEIQSLEKRLEFFVDIEPPGDVERRPASRLTRRFDVGDLNTGNASLLPYLSRMDPGEIVVVLEASGAREFTLSSSSVVVVYPEPREEWSRRVFLDSLEFEPVIVQLRGPEERLRQLGSSSQLFELDVRKLAQMQDQLLPQGTGGERPRVPFPLRLRERFASELRVEEPKLTASVEIAPPAFTSPEFAIRVIPDRSSSELDATQFSLDKETVKFRIRSYDAALTRRIKEQGEPWVLRWFRALVDIGRIPESLDTSKPDFIAELRPQFFFIGDEDFLLGKHFEIDVTSPLFLSRK